MQEKITSAIYIRVSTEDQAKDGFSVNAQREKLTMYAKCNDWDIYDYYVDDGISGKNLVDRPQMQRMLEDIKNGKINNVLIYKLDRLTRSVRDLIDLIEIFENNNCTFNSQTEKIDTSNAVGRMFIKIIGIFAEFERENLAERVSFGYEQKTREGNYTNTNGVYGYDYVIGQQKLVINDFEKEIVNRIFDKYIEGNSYYKIACEFNMQNIPTKRGGKWAASTIKSIINNPLYIGKVRYGLNKTKDKSFTVKGNNIPSIISKAKWRQANLIKDKRKCYKTRRYPSENSYFFHFVKCSKCSGKILARQQMKNNKIYITYRCNNAIKGTCKSKGFSQINMEKAFLKYLKTINDFLPDKSIMDYNNSHNFKDKITKLKKQLKMLKLKENSIREKYIKNELNTNEYLNIYNEINDKVISLTKDIETNINENKKQSLDYCFSDIKMIVSNVNLNWQYLTSKEKRQFLELFIKEINVEKKGNNILEISSVEFVSAL